MESARSDMILCDSTVNKSDPKSTESEPTAAQGEFSLNLNCSEKMAGRFIVEEEEQEFLLDENSSSDDDTDGSSSDFSSEDSSMSNGPPYEGMVCVSKAITFSSQRDTGIFNNLEQTEVKRSHCWNGVGSKRNLQPYIGNTQLISLKCHILQSDTATGRWQRKVRGNIKIEQNKLEQQFRLVITHKTREMFADHVITSNMKLSPLSNSDRTLMCTWDVANSRLIKKRGKSSGLIVNPEPFIIKVVDTTKAKQLLKVFEDCPQQVSPVTIDDSSEDSSDVTSEDLSWEETSRKVFTSKATKDGRIGQDKHTPDRGQDSRLKFDLHTSKRDKTYVADENTGGQKYELRNKGNTMQQTTAGKHSISNDEEHDNETTDNEDDVEQDNVTTNNEDEDEQENETTNDEDYEEQDNETNNEDDEEQDNDTTNNEDDDEQDNETTNNEDDEEQDNETTNNEDDEEQ
ncbi:unnamed protein product, partial [Lymnaea stagnalis]